MIHFALVPFPKDYPVLQVWFLAENVLHLYNIIKLKVKFLIKLFLLA